MTSRPAPSTTGVRSFLDVTDLTADEIGQVLDLAESDIDTLGAPLTRQGVALIFEKPSNRTRHSMEMAVVELGGHPIYTRGEEVGFDTREPVEDVVRILAGYHAMVAARVFDHTVLDRMAAVSAVPIVNMLSDRSHPLQALADALTMRQCGGDLRGRTIAWVGDYNNVARSVGEISLLLGANVRYACPQGFGADEAEVERLALLATDGATVGSGDRPFDAVADADVVHTDTWVSMGQEDDKQARRRSFEGFRVDAELMAAAAGDAIFMHCLPAYRGVEVAGDVIDGPRSMVLRQGHNRLHAARGLLAFLVKEGNST